MTLRVLVDVKALESRSKESVVCIVVPVRLLTPGFVGCPVIPREGQKSDGMASALVGREDSGELLDLLGAEGRNEAVDIELLDGALDEAVEEVVDAEALHGATDSA
jgi:hypothetical protein